MRKEGRGRRRKRGIGSEVVREGGRKEKGR